MRKVRLKLMAVGIIAMLSACTTEEPVESEPENDSVNVTFNITPEPWQYTTEPMRTRALDADGKSMTDIWILDYIGTELQQQLHQSSTDADFGSPTLSLSVGSHNIYFVASRGSGASLDTDAQTLTFTKVLDTFYKSLALNVSATSAGAQSVALDRIVTKLKVTFTDAIPATASRFEVTPSQWNYSIDYTTGMPTDATTSQAIVVNIPPSSLGVDGESVSVFGFIGTEEWNTDITLNCKASDDTILGTATISDAKFKRNRVSAYSGPLFSSNGAMTLSLNSEWDTELVGTW